MYKKITHTITEEHFGHPVGAEIKKHVDKMKSANMPSSSQFKQDVLSWFTNFNNKAQTIIDSMTDSKLDTAAIEADLFDQIDALGNELKNYYGIEAGERLNAQMRNAAVSLLRLVFLVKNNLDIKDVVTNRFDGVITGEILRLLYDINNDWNFTALRPTVETMWTAWIDRAKAKKANNDTAAATALNAAKEAFTKFANTLADGVVKQHPEMFPQM
jgi:hypothetical protein